jgi:hypothetical protein
MATKIITLSQPSITFTNTIDWYLGDVFNAITFSDLNINFLNAIDGKRIIVSLTNSGISSINLNFASNVAGAAATIPGNKTQIYSLTKIGEFIYASLESSTDYGILFTADGTLTIPSNITTIYATVIPSTGGGGGAGMTISPAPGLFVGGGGGGGGGYKPISIRNVISVTPNSSISVFIGAGGSAGLGGVSPSDGANGATTLINTSGGVNLLSVLGGEGGKKGTHAGSSVGVGGNGGNEGGTKGNNGTYPTDPVGGSGGAGGTNPQYISSKGGNGGSAPNGSPNGGGYGSAGTAGTSAIVLITYT